MADPHIADYGLLLCVVIVVVGINLWVWGGRR